MWAERVADRSPSRCSAPAHPQIEQAEAIVDAARRLVTEAGEQFTTQELVNEAGVALQTFYRLLRRQGQLLLAVFEDLILEACEGFRLRAAGLGDPVERLHSHVTAVIVLLDEIDANRALPPASSPPSTGGCPGCSPPRWRRRRSPTPTCCRPRSAPPPTPARLRSTDPKRDAWLMEQLVLSVFHHHTCSGASDPDLAEDLWRFCLQGIGVEPTQP